MWPWGHLAVGYLVYAGLLDRRLAEPPDDLAVIVLAFGTQFPDLLDKPLSWHVGVLPNGRSLGHSLVIAVALLACLYAAARYYDRTDLAVAFGVGHLSHLAADGVQPFVAGRFAELAFLGWPLLPPVTYEGAQSLTIRFSQLAADIAAGDVSAWFAFEVVLVVVAIGLWFRHGLPGLRGANPRD